MLLNNTANTSKNSVEEIQYIICIYHTEHLIRMFTYSYIDRAGNIFFADNLYVQEFYDETEQRVDHPAFL